MEFAENTNPVIRYIVSIKQLSKPIKQTFVVMSLFIIAISGFSAFSYIQLNRSLSDQQDYIDLMSSEISSIEIDLSDAQQEIDWMKQTVNAVTDRVDTVCDFLRGYTWC